MIMVSYSKCSQLDPSQTADCRLKNMSENRLTFAVDTVRSRLILGCCDGDEQRRGLATHQMVSMNP